MSQKCTICEHDILTNKYIKLTKCRDKFHKRCIRRLCREKIKSNFNTILNCPKCGQKLSYKNVYKILNENRVLKFEQNIKKNVVNQNDKFKIIIKNNKNKKILKTETLKFKDFLNNSNSYTVEYTFNVKEVNPKKKYYGHIKFLETGLYLSSKILCINESLSDSSESESDIIDPTNNSTVIERAFQIPPK